MTWAQRLARVFRIDVTRCEHCGGPVRIIASLPDPAVLVNGLVTNPEEGGDDTHQQIGYAVDCEIVGLDAPGQSVQVVVPLAAGETISTGAVWRKLVAGEWRDFVEDETNALESASLTPAGSCPGAGADTWEPGLVAGHACIRLALQEGGPNDADGMADGVIVYQGTLSLPAGVDGGDGPESGPG